MAEHARSSQSQSLLTYLCLCLLLLSSSAHLAMSMALNDTDDRFSSEVAPARPLYGDGSTDQQNTNTSSNKSSDSPWCRLLSLQVLDLANNQLTGKLPDCWREMQALQFMDVSNNSFSGDIPEGGKMGVDVHGLQHGAWERERRTREGRNCRSKHGGCALRARMAQLLARRARRDERGRRADRQGAAVAREREDQPAQADTM